MASRNTVLTNSTIKRWTDKDGIEHTDEESKRFKIAVDQDSFYMVYFTKLSGFYNITSAVDMKMLTLLCERADYNTGVIDISTMLRDEICLKLKIKTSQISRSLKSLEEKRLIFRNKDRVEINPICFWKGSNDSRRKLLEKNKIEIKVRFCKDCDDSFEPLPEKTNPVADDEKLNSAAKSIEDFESKKGKSIKPRKEVKPFEEKV